MAGKKEGSEEKRTRKVSNDKINEMLIENFVNLQKALTDLTGKFDSLAEQMSKLLALFEVSAKSFAEKLATGMPDIEKDREFLDKLNTLVEQNKLIAKGLTLMEDNLRERMYGSSPMNRPPARFPQQSRAAFPSSFERNKLKPENL